MLELLFPLGNFAYFDQLTGWELKRDGVTTTARILSSRKGPHSGRGSIHGVQMYLVRCEYRDRGGATFQGTVELPEDTPHAPGNSALVTYLPSNPNIVMEDDFVRSVKDPMPGRFIALCWIVNPLLFAVLYRRVARHRSANRLVQAAR